MLPAENDIPVETVYDSLDGLRQVLDKCMHCGFCMAVCPVYKTLKTEAGVARGKIGIAEAILRGDLSLEDERVVDLLHNCLVCKSCMQNCPTKVDFGQIILALRCAAVRQNGLPWQKKLIFGALKHPKLFDRGMKTGALFSGVMFRRADNNGMAPRGFLTSIGKSMGFDEDRRLPALAKKPLRDRLPALLPVADPVARVAFFTGCSFNYMYPETGEDLVAVLQENKVEVVVPQEQGCCGVPAFVHGDVETIRALGRQNIDAMERSGVDYIITGCGSCGGSWQHDYNEVFKNDPVYGPKASYWGSRTYDISTFLTQIIQYRAPQGKVNAVVTYHDPCHLKKVMKVFKEPRDILKNIPGVQFKEMTRADSCCGSGGSYVLTHFETSTAIAKRKMADVNKTEADTITTGCPACMMQLSDGANRYGEKQNVQHYISLLAQSYRNEKK
jgi:glycolate oxidase iron-sulfur subunit